MRFTSTNSNIPPVGLAEAINKCVACDGGMFMPAEIPTIPRAFYNNIAEMDLRDIAYVVATTFFGDDIPASTLKNIVDDAFRYDIPLRKVGDAYVLELFHGPTLTFKDYGARFMARLMQAIDATTERRTRNVLVATTGNTGAAAASGLFKIEGISVTVLYPRGKLSRTATAQFTALGENIHPVEIAGSVEDCKALVQEAIADPSMTGYNLTGANSINVARLLPQVTFLLHAYARLLEMGVSDADKALYSIPCGNLSNLVAATIARRLGCPAGGLIGATNANDQLRPLMEGKEFHARAGVPLRTWAPSIDMSTPSGWMRLAYLYGGDLAAMRSDIHCAAPVTDTEIADTINSVRADAGYTLDPHGAIAWAAAHNVAADGPRVIFATGHPAKQLDIMTRITGAAIELPVQLNQFMSVRRHPAIIAPTLPALRKHLHAIQ